MKNIYTSLASTPVCIAFLSVWLTAGVTTFGQPPAAPADSVQTEVIEAKDDTSSDTIRAGGIDFRFVSAEEGRKLLSQEDQYAKSLSVFDRQVRLRSKEDPGIERFLQFTSEQVIAWPESDQEAIRLALEKLDAPLSEWNLPAVKEITFVRTNGREESGAAYTRGTSIILPNNMAGSRTRPPTKLIAHELFHVLSRSDRKWRDALYSVIGFRPTKPIELPEPFESLRMTNPDAPVISHVMDLRLSPQETATVAPLLMAKTAYDPSKTSLFAYLDFQLMEVVKDSGKRYRPRIVDEQLVLHKPTIPDFHRQIGGNTGYIIHPDEILADNFVILVTGVKAKDAWLIDKISRTIKK